MSDQQAVETLNKLLDAESVSFITRLGEACPFADSSEAAEQTLIGKLVAESRLRKQRLTELILKLRGSPTPPRRAIDTTSLHYVQIAYLMPRIASSLRDLVAVYAAAARTGNLDADALVARHLAELKKSLADLEAAAPSRTAP